MRNNQKASVTCAVLGLMLIGILTAEASFTGEDIYVPSVGRGEGASGSYWYTTVWFHNPGSDAVVVTIGLLLRNQANPNPEEQFVTVPAASTMTFSDAINDLFSLESFVGALRIQAAEPIAVGARIFNQPGDTISESQGQLMAGLPAGFSVAPGESVDVPGILEPADGSFRCNFGLVETSGSNAAVDIKLLDHNGTELGSKRLTLGPYYAYQRSIASVFPDQTVEGGILHVEVTGTSGSVLAFASAVAAGVESQDPMTLEMTLDPKVLGGSQEGGITGIEAGPGLTGGGNEGVVTLQALAGDGIEVTASGISIEPGWITADHIPSGEVVLGAKVGSEVLTDVVTFEGGANVYVDSSDNTITISAMNCFGQRQEMVISQALTASLPGEWAQGYDQLSLPSAGRWKIGYRVLAEIRNSGYGTASDPINIALFDATGQEMIRSSMSVLGLPVALNSSVFTTVSAESVIEVDRPTTIILIARTSSGSLVTTVHAHDADISAFLPSPDAASFLYSECLTAE